MQDPITDPIQLPTGPTPPPGNPAPPELFQTPEPPTPPQAPPSAPAPPAAPAEPVLRTVNQQETTQGQLTSLFAEGSPLLVQARENAQRLMTGRGLQNSTMAAQAGEQALFASALPIAQFDAQVHGQAAQQNNQTQNTFGLADLQHRQNLVQLAAQGDQDARMALLSFGYERNLTQLRGDIAKDQSNLDFANRLVELATQGDIQSTLQAEQFGFNTQLSAQENLQRLEQLVAQGDINAALQLQQFQYQSLLADQNLGHQITLEDARFQNTQSTVMLEYAQRGVLSQQEAMQEMERLNQQHENTLAQIAAQIEASTTADTAAAGRALQNNYLLSVADRQRAASQEIAEIYQTQGLSSAQQNAAVQNAYNRMRADIATLQSYYSASPMWDPNFNLASATSPSAAPGAVLPPPGTVPFPQGTDSRYLNIRMGWPQ